MVARRELKEKSLFATVNQQIASFRSHIRIKQCKMFVLVSVKRREEFPEDSTKIIVVL
jgi:hypothetical protein